MALTVRTGARAAVGVVTEGVDVHAALGVGIVAGDVVCDGRLGAFGCLLEVDGSFDVGVSSEDGDCSRSSVWFVYQFAPPLELSSGAC